MPNDGEIVDHGDGHPIQRWNPFIGIHGQRDGQDDEPHSTDDPMPYPRMRFNPTSVGEFHLGDDVDASMLAHHHTLGPKRLQAAPGNHQHNGVDSYNIGQWVDWSTPARTSWGVLSGTAPSAGNALIDARYCKVGNRVDYKFAMQPGSSTTFGSGGFAWVFTLPFAGRLPPSAQSIIIGQAYGFQSGASNYIGGVELNTTTTVFIESHTNPNAWYANNPVTWVSGSSISFSVSYESLT